MIDDILVDPVFWAEFRRIMVARATPLFREAYLVGAALGAREQPVGAKADDGLSELGWLTAMARYRGELGLARLSGYKADIPGLDANNQPIGDVPIPFDFDDIARGTDDVIAAYTDDWWESIERTTRERMRVVLRRAAREGLSPAQVAEQLTPLFGAERAQRIAVAETTNLLGMGAQETYKRAGYTGWIWRTARDTLVDPTCDDLRKQSDPKARPPGRPFPMTRQFQRAHIGCRCWPVPAGKPEPRLGQPPQLPAPQELGDFALPQDPIAVPQNPLAALNKRKQEAARDFARKSKAARSLRYEPPDVQRATRAANDAAAQEYIDARDAWRAVSRETVPDDWIDAGSVEDATKALSDRGITSNVAVKGDETTLEWIDPKDRKQGLNSPLPQRERLETLNRFGRLVTEMRQKFVAARDVALEDVFLSANHDSLFVVSSNRDKGKRLAMRITSPQKWERGGALSEGNATHFMHNGQPFTYSESWEDSVRHEMGHAIMDRTPEIEGQLRTSWYKLLKDNTDRMGNQEKLRLLSHYGTRGGVNESIAEVMSVLTNPKYGTPDLPAWFGLAERGNRFPRWIEQWGQKMLAGLIP